MVVANLDTAAKAISGIITIAASGKEYEESSRDEIFICLYELFKIYFI